MKHSMVTFRLHRIAVIFMIVGAILVALFIFAGGYLLGSRRGKTVAAPVVPAVPAAVPAAGGLKPAAPLPPAEDLAVRVGIFDTEEEAKTMVQQLAIRKRQAAVVPITTSVGVTLYTVQVGHYATRAEAAAAAAALKDEEGLQGAVVPAGAGRMQ